MATFMTPRQVGQKWGMSARHIRRLCAGGSLRAMRLGLDAWRISLDDVTAYELRRANTTSAEDGPHACGGEPPSTAAGGRTSSGVPTHVGEKHGAVVDGFTLPADYEPCFPALWPGHAPQTKKSAAQR